MRFSNSFGISSPKIEVEKGENDRFIIYFKSSEGLITNQTYLILRADEMESLRFQIESALLHEEMTEAEIASGKEIEELLS